jgi:hypothetical protein
MDTTASSQPAITIQLTRDFYYLIVDALRGAVPPPASRSTDDIARRDNALIAGVASLRPANADQVLLAVQYVAASLRSLHCIEEAHEFPADDANRKKCTAQSALMMRQARGARAMLAQFQRQDAERVARNPAAIDADAKLEQATVTLMAEALAIAPSPPRHTLVPTSTAAPASTPPKPSFDLTGAEQYALANPTKASLIRSLGRLPKKFDDPPPPPGVMNAVIHGASPILQKLYKKPLHRLIAA